MSETKVLVTTLEFEQWVNSYSPSLLNKAFYILSDKEDAKDLVQEVFLSAFAGIEKFKNDSTPLTWLHSILRYKAMDLYRQKYKSTNNISFEQVFDKHGEWNSADVSNVWGSELDYSDNLLDDENFNLKFNDCIDSLPPKWKILVNLSYIEGQKSEKICQDLSITKTNYWKLLQRSRLQLRECLDINWFKK